MTMMNLPLCLLLLLVFINAARVESARGNPPKAKATHAMFVFGDSFADNGNLPQTELASEMSRQWRYPYGNSYIKNDGNPEPTPTGRFSNYMVQSDFVARILGFQEAPPTYQLMGNLYCDNSGMTFAVGGSGVYGVSQGVPTLGMQVDTFERLIEDGTIPNRRVRNSIALVAISGNDYARVGVDDTSSFSDITVFIGKVTAEIVANVERLQKLGVKKVLVNNLHPVGCTPAQTRSNNYSACDQGANMGASVHNNILTEKLGIKENVFVVDLNTAFTNIVNHAPGEGSELSKQFKHKLSSCCESFEPTGYCGQQDESSEYLYYLCENPDKYFYWDDMHPTQAGWDAVMKQLEEPLKQFLAQD